MKIPLVHSWLFAASAAFVVTAHGAWPNLLQSRRDFEVITVTDMTPEGRRWPAPSAQQPQYYVPVSLGYRDLGGIIGRVKEPPEQTAVQTIARELAQRGYLPAAEKTPPPTLVLVFSWGTLNAKYPPSMTRNLPVAQQNRKQIVDFLGGAKMGVTADCYEGGFFGLPVESRLLDNDARDYLALANDNYYVAVVTAYDLAAMEKNPTLSLPHLWITRIACPSLGFSLPDALPSMIALAGPNFGRETARPVRVAVPRRQRPTVKYGELQVVEFLKEMPAPAATPKR
jgi:hypothetical protein